MDRANHKKQKIEDIFPGAFRVIANITWLRKRYNTSEEEIIAAIGKSQGTWINRKREPWTFTMEELTNIAALWGLTPEQLMVEPRLIVEPAEIL